MAPPSPYRIELALQLLARDGHLDETALAELRTLFADEPEPSAEILTVALTIWATPGLADDVEAAVGDWLAALPVIVDDDGRANRLHELYFELQSLREQDGRADPRRHLHAV